MWNEVIQSTTARPRSGTGLGVSAIQPRSCRHRRDFLIKEQNVFLYGSIYPIMLTMINNTISPELQEVAERLRMRRIARGDRQSDMAARIGVSVPTYRRMERGDPATPIGYWVKAMRLLGTVERLADTIPVSLFDEDDLKNRKRVRRRAASR